MVLGYVEKRGSLTRGDGYLECEETQWHDACNDQWHTLLVTRYFSRVCLEIKALDDVVWSAVREE